MARSLTSLCLLALAVLPPLSGQTPPPEVDSVLRARVLEFLQLQAAHKFRQSEQLVAEDSKDYYYESKKPEISEFELKEIRYEPDFRTAHVTVTMKTSTNLPLLGIPMTFVTNEPSDWKIEDGQWCWFHDPDKPIETPFGLMKPLQRPTGQQGTPAGLPPAPSFPQNPVQLDRKVLQLDATHPQPAVVTLKNALPGPITIETVTSSPALKVEISKTAIAATESATVTVTPVPGQTDRPAQLTLRIGPLGQTVQIGLEWIAGK